MDKEEQIAELKKTIDKAQEQIKELQSKPKFEVYVCGRWEKETENFDFTTMDEIRNPKLAEEDSDKYRYFAVTKENKTAFNYYLIRRMLL
jgi:hypothetical protein